MRLHAILAAFVISGLLAGCAEEPKRPTEEFGASVRNMIEQQTYNPDAAANPPSGIQEAFDGEKAVTAIKGYRTGRTAGPLPQSILQPSTDSSMQAPVSSSDSP